MITNRNNTRIAPAYTIICIAARKSAFRKRYRPAMCTKRMSIHTTLWIGFLLVTTRTDNPTIMAAK
jgi:hypothetical protein